MFYLILGGSKTGKSRYAEGLAVRVCRGKLLYLATMVPVGDGETGTACIRRHRAQREGLGFTTIERPMGLSELELPPTATVLLEDVSNLVANNLFIPGGPQDAQPALEDIQALLPSCHNLLAISFHGLTPGDDYDQETNHYIDELNRINQELFSLADSVVLLQEGVPSSLKGMLPEGR